MIKAVNIIFSILMVTLSILSGCSGGSASTSSKSTNTDSTILIKSGNNLFIRTTWDKDNDLVQYVSLSNGLSNDVVEFSGAWIHPKSTPNSLIPSNYSNGLLVAEQGDDATPAYYNGFLLGGNHGPDIAVKVYSPSHGKIQEYDIGSEWLDNVGRKWYLMKVIDSNNLWMISENVGADGFWNFEQTIAAGQLTHNLRAINTSPILVSAQTLEQLTPVAQGQLKQVYIDGITIQADGVYTGKSVEISNSYNVINIVSLLNHFTSLTGSNRTATFIDNTISADTRFSISYKFTTNGSCTVYHQFKAINDIFLGHIGFIQSSPINYAGKSLFVYVPKTVPYVGSLKTWDFKSAEDITTQIETVVFGPATWSDPDNMPDRSVQIVKAGGVATVGYIAGISQLSGVGVPAMRKTLTDTALNLFISRKNYMYGINGAGSAFSNHTMNAGNQFEAVAYRCFYNPKSLPESTVNTWYRDGSDIIVLLDFHQPTNLTKVALPAEFTGKKISIIDKTPSFTLHGGEFVLTDGLSVSITSEYGYAVLKLSQP